MATTSQNEAARERAFTLRPGRTLVKSEHGKANRSDFSPVIMIRRHCGEALILVASFTGGSILI